MATKKSILGAAERALILWRRSAPQSAGATEPRSPSSAPCARASPLPSHLLEVGWGAHKSFRGPCLAPLRFIRGGGQSEDLEEADEDCSHPPFMPHRSLRSLTPPRILSTVWMECPYSFNALIFCWYIRNTRDPVHYHFAIRVKWQKKKFWKRCSGGKENICIWQSPPVPSSMRL